MKLKTFVLYASLFCSGFACTKGEKGEDGFNSLVSYQNISAGANCPTGGISIKSGLDKNRNDVLDSVEVDNTANVCNGQNGLTDKQIFLPINFSAERSSTTPITGGQLLKFSKKNYPGVDSIIFVANPYVQDIRNTAIIELYNITDGAPISNSQIISNNLSDTKTFLQTGNVYNQLPDKEITLGVRFSAGTDGYYTNSGSSFLILYRR